VLQTLDRQVAQAAERAVTCDLWLDDYAFVTGVALVGCQYYITSSCGWMGVQKRAALSLGPQLNAKVTYAEALNAGADYWKHSDLWNDPEEAKRSKNTRRILSLMGLDPTDVFTAHDLFGKYRLEITELLPVLQDWRAAVWQLVIEREKLSNKRDA
jgi:hypothetical protein